MMRAGKALLLLIVLAVSAAMVSAAIDECWCCVAQSKDEYGVYSPDYQCTGGICHYLGCSGCDCVYTTMGGDSPWARSRCNKGWPSCAYGFESSLGYVPNCGGWGYYINDLSDASKIWKIAVCHTPPQCSDGKDNDGDGCIDFAPTMAGVEPDDGCSSALDTAEATSFPCCAKVQNVLGGGCRSGACPAEGDTVSGVVCGERYPAYPYCCCKAGYRFKPESRKCVERHQRCNDFTSCFDETSNPLECLNSERTQACCSGSIKGYDYDYMETITLY